MITAFIYDNRTFHLLAAGTWKAMSSKAFRMLTGIRGSKNASKAKEITFYRLYDERWDEKLRQPAELQKWLALGESHGVPLADLNPFKLSIRHIPAGHYCYRFTGKRKPDNRGALEVKTCPYLSKRDFGGVGVPWCQFLRAGSIPNETTEKQYNQLKKHFGGLRKMNEVLPLFLLWDGAKECGVKSDDE